MEQRQPWLRVLPSTPFDRPASSAYMSRGQTVNDLGLQHDV